MTNAIRPELAVTLAFALLGASCGPHEPVREAKPTLATRQAPQPARQETPKAAPVVVFLGDSLTAGYGLPASDALPVQVETLLRDRKLAVRVVNAGVSGDMTQGALDRYEWSVASVHPDLLVIALGANDYLNGLPAETPRNNLGKIIEQAKSDGVKVALLGVKTPNMASADTRDQAYAAIYPDLAKAYEVPLYASMLEGVLGHPQLVQSDGVHPTSEGVAIMAKQIADFLEQPVRALDAVKGP